MAQDRYATSRDNGVNLGAVSIQRAPSGYQQGGFFEDAGTWFESAARDVGDWLDDAVEDVGGGLKDALDFMVDGPIFHIAAGVCAVIPGAQGAAAAIEAIYWTTRGALQMASDAVEIAEPVIKAATAGVQAVAKQANFTIKTLTPEKALAALAQLEISAKTNPAAFSALIAGRFNLQTMQLATKFPDLLEAKGAPQFAGDKRLPKSFRATAAAMMLARQMPAIITPGLLRAYLSGEHDMATVSKAWPIVIVQARVFAQILKALDLPTKLPAGAKLKLAQVQLTGPLGSFRATAEATSAETRRLIAARPTDTKVGTTLKPDAWLVKKFPGLVPIKIVDHGPPINAKTEVLAAPFLKGWFFQDAKGAQLFAKAVADYYPQSATAKKLAPTKTDQARHWFLADPFRPTLTAYIVENESYPRAFDRPDGAAVWKDLLDFWTPDFATAAGKRVRNRVLAMALGDQLALVAMLSQNARTADHVRWFCRAVYSDFTWGKFSMLNGRHYETNGAESENAILFKALVSEFKLINAAAEAVEEGLQAALDANTGAVVAVSDLPRTRQGLLVEFGVLAATEGLWRLDSLEGLQVVVSPDGTADLGTWSKV